MNEAQNDATLIPAQGDDHEDRRVLRLVLFDALASEAMGTLTTGVFLVGFAVALGADNFAIGVLAAVPFFAQLLQIPAVLLVERWRIRRDICVFSTAIGRAFLIAAAATPLLGGALAVKVLIASLAIYQAMAAIAGCAWNSWMRDLVPSSEYGRFFGRRTAATTALSVVAALGGGAIIVFGKAACPIRFIWILIVVSGKRNRRLYRRISFAHHPRQTNGPGRKNRPCACATLCAAT